MRDLLGVRVCMATSAHPADDDRIFYREARSLVKAGADVVILCPRDMNPPARTDGVRFEKYDGGGRLRHRFRTINRLERAIQTGNYDVIHCHEPDSLLAALRVKNKTGAKVIFDSHEMWGGTFAVKFPRQLWKPVEKVYQAVERRYLRQCDAAIGAGWAISDYLEASVGTGRTVTILNVPVVEVFGEQEQKDWSGSTILCHEGHLTFNRGLKNIAEFVRRLSKQHDIVLRIIGDVFNEERLWLESFIQQHGLEKVITRSGWLPYEDVGKAVAPCHIGLVSLLPLPNNMVSSPNKCFNYLLYGLPIVGPRFPRSQFAVLEQEGCAVLADPMSVDAYEKAITALLENKQNLLRMAERALELSKEKYRWSHMEPVLFSLYVSLLHGARTNSNLDQK